MDRVDAIALILAVGGVAILSAVLLSLARRPLPRTRRFRLRLPKHEPMYRVTYRQPEPPADPYRETLREIGMAVPGCDDPFDFDAPVSPDKAEMN